MAIFNEMNEELFSKKEAIQYLGIDNNHFENYSNKSGEIIGEKIRNRWYFKKTILEDWLKLKNSRTVHLTLNEYEKCFEFAIRMVYGGLSLNGIRGQRSEVQAVDDVILGILAEHAIKKFMKANFDIEIELDEGVHPSQITPQDFNLINDHGTLREPKIGVGVKASKTKSGFLVLGANEIERVTRKSDAYVFARVNLPSDHLFRILRDHSFFNNAKNLIEADPSSRNIESLESIPVWICGITYLDELEKATLIPGQEFSNGHRYVKSVSKMHNSDSDWRQFVSRL